MTNYINNYSVVSLSQEGCYWLCKKEDTEKTFNEIVAKYEVVEDEIEDNVFSDTLKAFIEMNNNGDEETIYGAFNSISISDSQATKHLLNNFDKYFGETRLNEICYNKENVASIIIKTIETVTKELLKAELVEMLEDLKKLD